jgi:hypothetical protein
MTRDALDTDFAGHTTGRTSGQSESRISDAVSSIRRDIRQIKSGIRPETGYQKRQEIRCISNYDTRYTGTGT